MPWTPENICDFKISQNSIEPPQGVMNESIKETDAKICYRICPSKCHLEYNNRVQAVSVETCTHNAYCHGRC